MPPRQARSMGLCQWYINITLTFLNIIHRPVFYLKHDVSEMHFVFHLRVEPTQVGAIENVSLYQSEGSGDQLFLLDPLGWVSPEDETESSLRNAV
jgi:hypothetical protein